MFHLSIVETFSLYVLVVWVAAFWTVLPLLAKDSDPAHRFALGTLCVLSFFGVIVSYGLWDAAHHAVQDTPRSKELWISYYLIRTALLGMALTVLLGAWRWIILKR